MSVRANHIGCGTFDELAEKTVVQILDMPTDVARVGALKESVLTVWEAIRVGNFSPHPSPMNTSCPARTCLTIAIG